MSLDERPDIEQHRQLRRNYSKNEYGPDDGSVEAEEAMAAEGAAKRRAARNALAGYRGEPSTASEPDRRIFGWREDERYEDALHKDAS